MAPCKYIMYLGVEKGDDGVILFKVIKDVGLHLADLI